MPSTMENSMNTQSIHTILRRFAGCVAGLAMVAANPAQAAAEGIASGPTASYSIAFSNSYACLLYTSPSPRDRQKSRMPSSA